MSVYTETLSSGNVLAVPVYADFGEIIINVLLLSILAVLVLNGILTVVYDRYYNPNN